MTSEIIHRLHFAFTMMFHYLFPQLTMGLGLLIVVLKTVALRSGDAEWHSAARFWGRIFAINFVFGVVTGIPMEFQFGTNWARFSALSGGVVGQPLAMEGVFSFFLESAFLGLFLYAEKRLSPVAHWFSAVMVWLGSWISGFFIIVANAWMQHPVAYNRLPDGRFGVASFWHLLSNPWALIQYMHTMTGAVITGSFVMAAVGAFYELEQRGGGYGRIFLKVGVISGLLSSIAIVFPTGDLNGKYVARHQPVSIAAMEGLFHSARGAGMVILGQPNARTQQIDNPLVVNDVLSFLIYGTTKAEVTGLDQFPRDQWPQALELLFYCYHIMVGLGTWFSLVMAVAAFLLWRGRLHTTPLVLWALLLSFPLPYIANTAGWLIYGMMRTGDGYSHTVSAANGLFTLMGFMGLYALLGLLFTVLMYREISAGPDKRQSAVQATITAD